MLMNSDLQDRIRIQDILKRSVLMQPMTFNDASGHEDVRVSGGTRPLVLTFGTRWKKLVSFTPHCFTPRKKGPANPLQKRLGVTQQQRTISVPPDIKARLAGHAAQGLSLYWPTLTQRLGAMVRKNQAFSGLKSPRFGLWWNGDYMVPTKGFLLIISLIQFLNPC